MDGKFSINICSYGITIINEVLTVLPMLWSITDSTGNLINSITYDNQY